MAPVGSDGRGAHEHDVYRAGRSTPDGRRSRSAGRHQKGSEGRPHAGDACCSHPRTRRGRVLLRFVRTLGRVSLGRPDRWPECYPVEPHRCRSLAYGRGRRKRSVVPWLGPSLCASMLTPCRTAISHASHRPNPSPPSDGGRPPGVNGRKCLARSCATLGIRYHDAVQTVLFQ